MMPTTSSIIVRPSLTGLSVGYFLFFLFVTIIYLFIKNDSLKKKLAWTKSELRMMELMRIKERIIGFENK